MILSFFFQIYIKMYALMLAFTVVAKFCGSLFLAPSFYFTNVLETGLRFGDERDYGLTTVRKTLNVKPELEDVSVFSFLLTLTFGKMNYRNTQSLNYRNLRLGMKIFG